MLDIFANFDPEYNILGSTAFWLIICISPLFLYTLARGRFRSITTKFLYRNPLRKVNNTGIGFGYTASIFLLILYYNFIGIIPYTFSWTRHLVVNLSLSLLLWLRIVMIRFSSNPTRFIAHLVPTGTPLLLTPFRSEEHTSELQSKFRISYAVFCLKKKKKAKTNQTVT